MQWRRIGVVVFGMAFSITAAGSALADTYDWWDDGWDTQWLVDDTDGGSGGPGTDDGSSYGSSYDDWYHYDSEYYALYDNCMAITNEETAKSQMTTITVPVWRLSGNQKVAGTASVTVNSGIADKVALVFQEIYEGPQQFPMADIGGYSWRGETSRSEHNWGTALDLNSNSNYCIYTNGTTVGDHWTPGEDPYSFSSDCDVVKAFKNHGFSWGGDWPWGNIDYMHFSYFGT